MFDDHGSLDRLLADLGAATEEVFNLTAKALDVSGAELRKEWWSIARVTAGVHGKRYPASITWTATGNPFAGRIGVEVGPDTSKKQGGMGKGFEYGSINQPPHLDGHKAFDSVEPKFTRRIQDAASGVVEVVAGKRMVPYTNRAGRTRMVTEAQAAAWSRRGGGAE